MSVLTTRALQQDMDKQCVRTQDFTTPYNMDENVPPYQGIMFEVVATSSLKVKSLQLDVRLDPATADGLMVEAYVSNESYQEIMNDPNMWIRVAQTELRMLGGTTAVIPESDFQAFTIDLGQRRSIYISLVGGSYLEHTVYALAKTGELAAENKDLKVFVGTGFQGPSFKSPADTVLDPQFAGTIQYETAVACSALVSETIVSLAFVAELDDGSEEIARLPFLLSEAMGMVMDELLNNDQNLARLVAEVKLSRTNLLSTKDSDFGGRYLQPFDTISF